jgi:hypothetical protein
VLLEKQIEIKMTEMKMTITNITKNEFGLKGIEELLISELTHIRGGNSGDNNKTKETDVYDTRDT